MLKRMYTDVIEMRMELIKNQICNYNIWDECCYLELYLGTSVMKEVKGFLEGILCSSLLYQDKLQNRDSR